MYKEGEMDNGGTGRTKEVTDSMDNTEMANTEDSTGTDETGKAASKETDNIETNSTEMDNNNNNDNTESSRTETDIINNTGTNNSTEINHNSTGIGMDREADSRGEMGSINTENNSNSSSETKEILHINSNNNVVISETNEIINNISEINEIINRGSSNIRETTNINNGMSVNHEISNNLNITESNTDTNNTDSSQSNSDHNTEQINTDNNQINCETGNSMGRNNERAAGPNGAAERAEHIGSMYMEEGETKTAGNKTAVDTNKRRDRETNEEGNRAIETNKITHRIHTAGVKLDTAMKTLAAVVETAAAGAATVVAAAVEEETAMLGTRMVIVVVPVIKATRIDALWTPTEQVKTTIRAPERSRLNSLERQPRKSWQEKKKKRLEVGTSRCEVVVRVPRDEFERSCSKKRERSKRDTSYQRKIVGILTRKTAGILRREPRNDRVIMMQLALKMMTMTAKVTREILRHTRERGRGAHETG